MIATRRQDNGPPETIEIVLDRPLPVGATTRFIFNDGAIINTVEYTVTSTDTDGDGRNDACDNCPAAANVDQANADSDSLGDACDNCANLANADQANRDGDAFGDACDLCPDDANNDSDGDTICDSADQCPGADDRIDADGNGLPDCLPPIPAASAWGVIVLALSLLTGAKIGSINR